LYDVAHSQNIVSATRFLVESVNKSVNDFDRIYAGIGPGSFTGIRIGLSFANAMCQALGVPLAGISSLDLLAYKKRKCYNPAISFIRSRRQEVYTACYRAGKRVSGYLVLGRDDFIGFIKENDPEYLISSENDHRSVLTQDDVDIKRIFTYPSARDAFSLAEEYGLEAERKFLKPLYVRDF
jgi:tRNA threonylcarbamoyl adenosine modification protein YeaZ